MFILVIICHHMYHMYHHAIKQDGSLHGFQWRLPQAELALRHQHPGGLMVSHDVPYSLRCLSWKILPILFGNNRCLFPQRVFCRQTLRAYVGEPWLQETKKQKHPVSAYLNGILSSSASCIALVDCRKCTF